MKRRKSVRHKPNTVYGGRVDTKQQVPRPQQTPVSSEKQQLIQMMKKEISIINATFEQFKINAETKSNLTDIIPHSHISYRLNRWGSQRIADIERFLPEIIEAVSNQRGEAVNVRLDYAPLALEVPHPKPSMLLLVNADQNVPAHSMLLGQSNKSNGNRMIASFDEWTHILVAGTTGAGKSVLLNNMMISLCKNTSPDDLKIVLVDLKNEDMLPFKDLPHVEMFAGSPESAIEAISYVKKETQLRIDDPDRKPYRLVLWIDELAQLAFEKEIINTIGSIVSIGRSKQINVVAATQHPTEKGGMGSMMKANFALRLVGRVAPGQSYAATQRKKLYADLLPGKGSFLHIDGPNVERFQSYFISPNDVVSQADIIGYASGYANGYGSDIDRISPDISHDMGEYRAKTTKNAVSTEFPINCFRELTESEINKIADMVRNGVFDYRDGISWTRISNTVFGSRDPKRVQYLQEVINV